MNWRCCISGYLWVAVAVIRGTPHITMCKMEGEGCHKETVPRHLLQKIDLPPHACAMQKCVNCVTGYESYVLTPNFELLLPKTFILKNEHPEIEHENFKSTFYTCQAPHGTICNCNSDACNGPEDFCQLYNCSQPAKCECHLTHDRATITHVDEDRSIENPTIITIQTCMFRKKKFHGRRLQEAERASFKQNNLTLTFIDPVLTLPDSNGRLILRTDNYETLLTVKESRHITVPFELLAHKTILTAIFIAENGLSVDAEIHIEGKKICRLTGCIFCKENFRTFRCWQPFFQNLLWGAVIFLTMLSLIMIKIIVKTISWTIMLLIHQIMLLGRLIRMAARFCLLLGAVAGHAIRHGCAGIYEALEHKDRGYGTGLKATSLAALALCLLLDGAHASCSDYDIIQSDLKLCEHHDAWEETCKLTTSAEVTIKNIRHQSCLWFHSRESKPLFSLKITLESVECHFSTQRLYYTFPVQTRSQSQITCSQNKYCAWGEHCDIHSYAGLHFEAETIEARSYSGYSTCEPSNRGNGCIISHTPACAFKRVYFIPLLDKAYEVSKITGYQCLYNVALEHSRNGTISRATLKDKTISIDGIKIKLLGAYDQSTMMIPEKLVTSVTNPTEGYLVLGSEKNNPVANLVGAIQANTSYTKNFLFARDLADCSFFEDQLRCVEATQALTTMVETQEGRLPITRELHSLHLHQGWLRSKLLSSSAIKVQLHFSNYGISVQRDTVCPVIEGSKYDVTGCYKCGILAELTLTAKSSCKAGLVSVTFEGIQVHTKAVELSIEPSTITIKLLADSKCFEDKICLQSATNVQCRQLSFCLDEPSIELLRLQGKTIEQTASSTRGSIFEWVHFPSLNSAFFVLKFAGAVLITIGLGITISSTLITCCCNRK